jgi:flagellin-like hook-associated protein FlgL
LERIQSAIDLIDQHRVDVERRLSDIQDVDIAAAITRLSEAEILYEAALGTAARIYDLSLLNYL